MTKPPGLASGGLGPQVGRDEALAVHQRQIEVVEGGDGGTVALQRQAGDAGPLQQEAQQLGLLEDAGDQLAVHQVVARQGALLAGEHPIDGGHTVVGIVDGLAFAQQGTGNVLQAVGGKHPGRGLERLHPIDDRPPGQQGKELAPLAAGFVAIILGRPAPQVQGHAQFAGVLVEHADVELQHAPADDDVGIVARQPGVEAFEQGGAVGDIFQVEVQSYLFAGRRTEHVHLALAAAVQADAVELAALAGLDVQRQGAQLRAVVGCRAQRGRTALACLRQLHRRSDEALHEEAIRRGDIRLIDLDTERGETLLQVAQDAIARRIEPQDGAPLEVLQRQFAQLHLVRQ
ncbi:hypothetical protein Q3H58_002197 [Pseudomonas psychrotolerans]|nr:hypothetical protein [Pseudomonas psychrotolerans]